MKTTIFLFCIYIAFIGYGQNNEIEQIIQTADRYIAATKTGNIDLLDSAFNESAILMSRAPDGRFQEFPYSGYRNFVKSRGASNHKGRVESVEFFESVGIVKVILDFDSYFYVDYLSMIKIGNQWKIVNKVAHRQNLKSN
ncbi:nuclear transport factor 2 family protein [Ekhidna sp.]